MSDVADKATEIKKKIIAFIEKNGPSLPVAIAREIQIDSLFSSAFLSELLEEGQIRISKMKVGGSPLYYLPQQHSLLENFSRYLNGKEREALFLLKEKLILKDTEQEPSIRVALRGIKDFAFPFILENENHELYWRYFSVPEEEARKKVYEKSVLLTQLQIQQSEQIQQANQLQQLEQQQALTQTKSLISTRLSQTTSQNKKIKVKELDIFDKPKKQEKTSPEKFLQEVKSFLSKKSIELADIEKFDKKEVLGKVIVQDKKVLFLAIDKKRIDESDLLKVYKKAKLLGLPYLILTKAELSKKLEETINAYKNLIGIEKIE